MAASIPLEHEIEYPTSDGQPMAETLEYQAVMIDLIQGLRWPATSSSATNAAIHERTWLRT